MPISPTPDSADHSIPRLSVVTCAYNEEANIGRFLQSCLDSQGREFDLVEIIVVASGCTDRTEEIVRKFASEDSRVRLYVQPSRQGKASALALGLRQARGDVVLIAGSDTAAAPGALEAVVGPFRDPGVSLVCAHPTPRNASTTFAVSLAKTMWAIHHVLSTLTPKAGEAFAVRNRTFELPADIQDDDTYLGAVSVLPGTRAVYAGTAVFYNRVPTTAADFLRQRWRINRQELGLERATGIQVSSWQPQFMFRAVGSYLREHPASLLYVFTFVAAEGAVRVGALVTTALVRKPIVHWEPIQSTKGPSEPSQGRDLPRSSR